VDQTVARSRSTPQSGRGGTWRDSGPLTCADTEPADAQRPRSRMTVSPWRRRHVPPGLPNAEALVPCEAALCWRGKLSR
jgi:hypothetical protein